MMDPNKRRVMKKLFKSGLLLLALASAFSLGAAKDEAVVKVQASRALIMAVVDLDRNNPASEPLHEAFKESLSFEMSQRCKMPTPIKLVRTDASRAGWGLGTGAYEVGLVIGGVVPKSMVSSDFTIIKAQPESGENRHIVSLVTRNEDPGLAKLLAEAFPEALKSEFFQKALVRYSGGPEKGESGWKVAGLGN
jgi:hypothetical protein